MSTGIIRKADLKREVGLSPTTVWRLERAGKFPRRIKISEHVVGWLRRDIEAWLEERAAESGAGK